MHRRAVFFLCAAILCAVLIPLTPEHLRWFAVMLATIYALLAGASWLDSWSRQRHHDS